MSSGVTDPLIKGRDGGGEQEVLAGLHGVLHGMAVGMRSIGRIFLDSRVELAYGRYLLRAVVPVAALLYTVLAFTLFPVLLALLIWAPGLLLAALTLIPLWALRLAQAVNPRASAKLFAEGVRAHDQPLADRIRRKIGHTAPRRGRNIFRSLLSIAKQSGAFAVKSLLLWCLSVVPLLGSLLTLVGQTYLVTSSLGKALMVPYVDYYCEMRGREMHRFFRRFRWPLFGFALPWTAVLSIPLVGPFLVGLALAGSSDFYLRVIRRHWDKEGEGGGADGHQETHTSPS